MKTAVFVLLRSYSFYFNIGVAYFGELRSGIHEKDIGH